MADYPPQGKEQNTDSHPDNSQAYKTLGQEMSTMYESFGSKVGNSSPRENNSFRLKKQSQESDMNYILDKVGR